MNWDDIDLPDGWRIVTTGEIAQVVGGGTPKTSVNGNFADEGGHPWVTPADLTAYPKKYISRGRRDLSDQGLHTSSAKYMPAGTVLFSSRAPIGYVAIASNPVTTNQGFRSFVPSDQVESEYLYYALKLLRPDAEQLASGTTFAELSGTNAKRLQFPLAPRESQRAIVGLLDDAARSTTSAAAHLAKAARVVAHFRQAVLTAACSGRLTEHWRSGRSPLTSDDALGIELAALRGKRKVVPTSDWKYGDIPDGWATISLDEATQFITSGSRGWAKYYSDTGPLFIRAQNINADWLDLSDCAHVVPPGGSEGVRTRVQTSDLLITITGANVTKSAWVDRDIGEAYVNQHVALARPLIEEMADFLHLWLISPSHGRAKLSEDAYGAGKPGLNLDNVRSLPVGVPPLEEQREIVLRTRALFTLAEALSSRINGAAHRVDSTSQAMIAKAFRGELLMSGRDA